MEIIDTREESKDFIFRKVFCPVYDLSDVDSVSVNKGDNKKSTNSVNAKETLNIAQLLSTTSTQHSNEPRTPVNTKNPTGSPNSTSTTSKPIAVLYRVESKSSSLTDVVMNNVTIFVSIETILDFVDMASSNAGAFASLLAPPSTTTAASTTTNATSGGPTTNIENSTGKSTDRRRKLSRSSSIAANNSTVSTSTMNVTLKIRDPRLLVLDDPTTLASRAILCKNEINLHYTRDVVTRTAGFGVIATPTAPIPKTGQMNANNTRREIDDSLHVSLKNNEIFVILNMLGWNPRSILEPVAIEYHLRRKILDDQVLLIKSSIDVDSINARISVNDLLLAQSIVDKHKSVSKKRARENLLKSKRKQLVKPVVNDISHSTTKEGESEPLKTEPISSGNSCSNNSVLFEEALNDSTCDINDLNESEDVDDSYMYADETDDTKESILLFPSESTIVNVGTVSLVAVNDFRDANIPVVRLLLSDLVFSSEREAGYADSTRSPARYDGDTWHNTNDTQVLRGEGSLHIKGDFYNPVVSYWEPFIEPWSPRLSIALGAEEERALTQQKSIYTLSSDTKLQLTVSSIMITKLLETYSTLVHDIGREDDFTVMSLHNNGSLRNNTKYRVDERIVADITISNLLGVSVDIFASGVGVGGNRLLFLNSESPTPLPKIDRNADRRYMQRKGQNVSEETMTTETAMTMTAVHSSLYDFGLTYPSAVDVYFSHSIANNISDENDLSQQRMPLLHLPLSLSRPKLCQLIPCSKKQSQSSQPPTPTQPVMQSRSKLTMSSKSLRHSIDSMASTSDGYSHTDSPDRDVTWHDSDEVDYSTPHLDENASAKGSGRENTLQSISTSSFTEYDFFNFEPVEEEVYENSRYEPLTSEWLVPFLFGDPYEWTDVTCTVRRDIDRIRLPNESTTDGQEPAQAQMRGSSSGNTLEWEWIDSWCVDVESEPGEIDNEGWEYATSFNQFHLGKYRL